MTRLGEPRAFFDRAMLMETDDCILWPYATARGYPKMWWIDGRNRSVHRLSCEEENGPCPVGEEAAHNCGARGCINRRHLRWKTCKENHSDKIIHGRTNRGERQGRAKLTSPEVLEIKSRLAQGEPPIRVAADYPVTREVISRIKNGQNWSWL